MSNCPDRDPDNCMLPHHMRNCKADTLLQKEKYLPCKRPQKRSGLQDKKIPEMHLHFGNFYAQVRSAGDGSPVSSQTDEIAPN